MKNIIALVLLFSLSACGAAVTPATPPSIYIDPSCTLQESTWIINASNGVPVDQTGPYRQGDRAYWGAQYIFMCQDLASCNDLVVDPPQTSRDWIVLAPNCDTTQQAFEARVRGYIERLQ